MNQTRGGHGRASMREVAQLAGVAMSSVSRVLSGHPDVSDRMREQVMAAVDELGYEPDLLAQSLRLRATKSIGFVVGDISNPLLAEITLGAEVALRTAGYSTLLTNSENNPDLDASHVRLLQQRRVDGILLSLASEDHEPTLQAIRGLGVPATVIDRDLPVSVPASAVLSDHRSGMRAAVHHLLELGHRRIGLILGQQLRFSRERRHGLEDAYRELGIDASAATIVTGALSPAFGREATARLLEQAEPVTALVAGGNQLLVGTVDELQRRDLRVGADISLVSCDAISLTELYVPPIAVVRRDNRELGRQAARVMLRHLDGETTRQEVVLPTEFVPRPSCAPPAG